MVKAAIFDKDGVVVHTTELYYLRWQETFVKFNKKLDREFYEKKIMGRSAKDNLRNHINSKLTNEDLTKILQEQFHFTKGNFDQYVTLVSGIEKYLADLNKAGMILALATSSRKETTDIVLDKYHLRKYFKAIVTADNLKHAKPDPEIFLIAAEKLKIKPDECVVFEDSHSGVEAARRAGMKVVLVMTSHNQKAIPNTDLAIKDFTTISVKDIEML